MSARPAGGPMVSICMSVVEWEIVILALTRAADELLADSTCVVAGRKVLRHIARHIAAELPSQQPT